MNRTALGTLFLLLSCYLYSCSFKKLVAGKKPEVYVWHVIHNNTDSNGLTKNRVAVLPQPDSAISNNDSLQHLVKLIDQFRPVWNKRLQFNTFIGRAKMKMEAPDDKQDFTAHFRIRKDSVIWVNVTALGGISFAKILITRDSFFMVNMLQKTATCVPLASAAKILPSKVDFSSLQNLIIGEPLRGGEITEVTELNGKWSARVEDSSYVQELLYNKSDSTLTYAQLRTHSISGPTATTNYNSYESSDSRKLSTGRELKIQNGNDVYSLEMNFVKFSFDDAMDFPFSIPKSYTIKEQ